MSDHRLSVLELKLPPETQNRIGEWYVRCACGWAEKATTKASARGRYLSHKQWFYQVPSRAELIAGKVIGGGE